MNGKRFKLSEYVVGSTAPLADDKEQDDIRGLNRVKTMFVKGTVTMRKEDFIALGISEELAKKCANSIIRVCALLYSK